MDFNLSVELAKGLEDGGGVRGRIGASRENPSGSLGMIFYQLQTLHRYGEKTTAISLTLIRVGFLL